MNSYQEYLNRKKMDPKFTPEDLNPDFIRFFESGTRIKVRFSYGHDSYEDKTGTVGVTTGWRPVFLLMLRKTDRGSSWTIGKNDKVIAVKVNREYIPV